MESGMVPNKAYGVNLLGLVLAAATTVLLGFGAALAQHDHAAMQGDHMMMHQQAPARLEVKDDAAKHVMTVRLGPLDLPAGAGMNVPQAPKLTFTIPFEGWLTAYHPRLADDAGKMLPPRLLHHVAFFNLEREDLLCPGKPEHIFGAGGEMKDWPTQPGLGYRVNKGDELLVDAMVHNDTGASYPAAYLEVKTEYVPLTPGGPQLKNVYPTWFDVQKCGPSSYGLEPGKNITSGEFTLGYGGVLIGVGGHLHDYGQQLQLVNTTRNEEIASLNSELDTEGRLVSVPIVSFASRGGYHLNQGDVVRVTATYDNPTDRRLPEAAMGIVVGYFLPDDDGQMAGLRKGEQAVLAHH
jgi:hypothetical protein